MALDCWSGAWSWKPSTLGRGVSAAEVNVGVAESILVDTKIVDNFL